MNVQIQKRKELKMRRLSIRGILETGASIGCTYDIRSVILFCIRGFNGNSAYMGDYWCCLRTRAIPLAHIQSLAVRRKMKRTVLSIVISLLTFPYIWLLWKTYEPSALETIVIAMSLALYLPVWYAIIRYEENKKIVRLVGACLLAPMMIRLLYSITFTWYAPCKTNIGCHYLDIFYLSMIYGIFVYVGYRIKKNMI